MQRSCELAVTKTSQLRTVASHDINDHHLSEEHFTDKGALTEKCTLARHAVHTVPNCSYCVLQGRSRYGGLLMHEKKKQ